MRTEDSPRFKKAMADLFLAAKRKYSDPTTGLFWKRLKAAPIDVFEAAVDKWIDENHRFPAPKDLRELCGLNPGKGPTTPQHSPYARLTAAERAFGIERGYLDPVDWWEAYGAWEWPNKCHCAACVRAGCPVNPILVPEMVTLLDGRQVEMGRELHGDELNEHVAKRNEYEMAIEAWMRRVAAAEEKKKHEAEEGENTDTPDPYAT